MVIEPSSDAISMQRAIDMQEKEASPNLNLNCNICNETITHICLLSPDWSAESSFHANLPAIRKHMQERHQINPPS